MIPEASKPGTATPETTSPSRICVNGDYIYAGFDTLGDGSEPDFEDDEMFHIDSDEYLWDGFVVTASPNDDGDGNGENDADGDTDNPSKSLDLL